MQGPKGANEHPEQALPGIRPPGCYTTYYAGQIDTITSDMQAEQRGMIFRRLNHQPEISEQLVQDNLASMKALRRFIELDSPLLHDPTTKIKLQAITDNLALIDRSNPAFLEMVRQNHLDAAIQVLDSGLAEATDKASADGADMLDLQQKSASQDGKARMAEARHATWIMFLMLLPGTGIGLAVLVTVRRLDANLRQSVEDLKTGSSQIAGAAREVASSGQTLTRDASQQAAMIEETSASSEQINAMARRNIEHASTADHQMAELKQLMNSSSTEMLSATAAML